MHAHPKNYFEIFEWKPNGVDSKLIHTSSKYVNITFAFQIRLQSHSQSTLPGWPQCKRQHSLSTFLIVSASNVAPSKLLCHVSIYLVFPLSAPLEQRSHLVFSQMLSLPLPKTVPGTQPLSEDFLKETSFVCGPFVDWPPLTSWGPAGQPRPPTYVLALAVNQAPRFTCQGTSLTFNEYIFAYTFWDRPLLVVSLCLHL